MKTKTNPIIVVAIISGIFMFVSGICVVSSTTTLFPPVMTVIFAISSVITISSVVCYNKNTN